jgi:ribose transport system permease protein
MPDAKVSSDSGRKYMTRSTFKRNVSNSNATGGAAQGTFSKGKRGIKIGQREVVFGIEILLLVGLSIALPSFLKIDNLLSLLQNVAILGILSLGMGIVVIGGNIDLSIEMTMAVCAAFSLYLAANGMPLLLALGLGLGFAISIGIINGLLSAYVEIPSIFTTLAMMSVIIGFGRVTFVESDSNYVPQSAEIIRSFCLSTFLGVPATVIIFAVFALLAYLLLRYTKFGLFTYAIGDNLAAARIAGIAVRPMTVLILVAAACIAFIAGLVLSGVIGEVHTKSGTLLYDVLLVVAIGGIGLSGGTGGVSNVLAGTLLIGTVLNGMTILDISYTKQNIAKGIILLVALFVDSVLNPRDEQTARQSDI